MDHRAAYLHEANTPMPSMNCYGILKLYSNSFEIPAGNISGDLLHKTVHMFQYTEVEMLLILEKNMKSGRAKASEKSEICTDHSN